MLIKILFSIAIAYITVVTIAYFFQRHLLFFPTPYPGKPSEYGLDSFEEVNLTATDGTMLNAWLKRPDPGKATILFFQGNGDTLANYPDFFRALGNAGLGVLAVNYRSYGGSEGIPTEENIYSDSEDAFQFLETNGFKKIIVLGRSLGSGVAVNIATKKNVAGVILLSPYTSIMKRASELYWFLPVRFISNYKFNSLEKISRITVPILLVHGSLDTLLPPSNSNELMAAVTSPKKELKLYSDSDHNNINYNRLAADILEFANGIN